MRRLLLLSLVLLLSLCLPLGAKSRQEKQLQSNLAQWEQFRWQGMAQVMQEALTMRKFYVLSKNTEAFRVDILDSGVMGLNARPILALYIKDRIVLDAPGIGQLQGIDPNWFITPNQYKPFFTMTSTLMSHSAEIIANHKIILAGNTYLFDKKFCLTGIKSPGLQIEARIIYNRKKQPDKITVLYQNKPLAILTIDERTNDNIDITPLEPSNNPLNSDIPNSDGTEE